MNMDESNLETMIISGSSVSHAQEVRSAPKEKKRLSPAQQRRQEQAEELRKLPYEEYLKTPYWQQRRIFALKRAEFRCQVCYEGNRELHIHHRTYKRLGMEKANDIIVLCDFCHELFHKNGKLAKEEKNQDDNKQDTKPQGKGKESYKRRIKGQQ